MCLPQNETRTLEIKTAFLKLVSYCAYQERCTSEVRKKLRDLEIPEEDALLIIDGLRAENFLNEKRFVFLYVGNKFRLKRWGRYKIINGLKAKKVNERYIEPAFEEEIEPDDYQEMMQYLIERKKREIRAKDPISRKDEQKVIRYMMQKGYEISLILEELRG